MKTLSLLALISLCSCANIEQTLVAPEIQSPVISQAGDLGVGGSVARGRSVELYRDASARPPTYSTQFDQVDDEDAVVFGGLTYALKGIALSGGLLSGNAFIDGLWLGGKMQLMGSQSLLTEDMPFHLALNARVGGQGGSKDGDKKGEFGPTGYRWEAKRSGSFINAGLSIGYRLGESFLPYLGYGIGSADAKATVNQKLSNDGLTPAASYANQFNADMASWGGGFQILLRNGRVGLAAQRTKATCNGASVYDTNLTAALELVLRSDNPAFPVR